MAQRKVQSSYFLVARICRPEKAGPDVRHDYAFFLILKKWSIAILLIFFSSHSFSQNLNLQDAINIALKNSLDIQLQKNYVEIAKTNNYVGVAGGLPVITAGASDNEQLINVNQKLNTGVEIKRSAAPANNLSANVTAGMLLYNGSRVVATRKRLAQLESQSEEYLNSQVQNIIASVMTG